MEVACFCMILLMSLILKASSQNIQIQVLPQPVIYQENDLVIQCSITNPSQLSSVYYIQLHRNSSTGYETVVSIFIDQTLPIQWPSGSTLRNRASTAGSEINTPSSATLKLAIDKNRVLCPNDFTEYRCKMSGFSSAESAVVTQETNPVAVTYTVNPRVIEMPRVRILGELTDTPLRRFPISTVLQLTCEGQIGNDARKTIRWCTRKSADFTFTGLPQTPIHSEASPSGCQYTRSSTVTYNLTSADNFTQFLCESGDTGMCGTGSAIQYVNISLASSQNIQIQVFPQPVIYQENDLVIQCSITNPSQLSSVYYIQLHRNSSTGFDTVVSIFQDQTPQIQWPSGSTLQNRASAEGSEINTPSTAKLKLTVDKNSVLCPNDFTEYRCKMSGFSKVTTDAVTQETNPVTITYTVKPRVIEIPRVRISGELTDTPLRQFPISTVLQLTCEGHTGNDANKTIRWCVRKVTDFTFTDLPQTPVHSEALLLGCQYTRSSTITYTLTGTDIFTQFLCASGDTGMCGTGSAIQYVNISLESNLSKKSEELDLSASYETGVTIGSVIGALALLTTAIGLVYFAGTHYKCTCEKTSGENARDSLQNKSDLVESGYTTITDDPVRHQDTYDEITRSEEKNQYEAIPEKESQGDYTHPYESLKKNDNAQHGIEKEDASNSHTSGISKKAEK